MVYLTLETQLTEQVNNPSFPINLFLFSGKILIVAFSVLLDSEESARREIAVFFKDFSIKDWYKNEEVYFQSGKVQFDPESFLHFVDKTILDSTKNYKTLS